MQINVAGVLVKLKNSVNNDNFEFVTRANRSKNDMTRVEAKVIVSTLVETDFQKHELDYDGSGEYVWIFISSDGIRYYIKLKFLQNDRVKFISFHEAEY